VRDFRRERDVVGLLRRPGNIGLMESTSYRGRYGKLIGEGSYVIVSRIRHHICLIATAYTHERNPRSSNHRQIGDDKSRRMTGCHRGKTCNQYEVSIIQR